MRVTQFSKNEISGSGNFENLKIWPRAFFSKKWVIYIFELPGRFRRANSGRSRWGVRCQLAQPTCLLVVLLFSLPAVFFRSQRYYVVAGRDPLSDFFLLPSSLPAGPKGGLTMYRVVWRSFIFGDQYLSASESPTSVNCLSVVEDDVYEFSSVEEAVAVATDNYGLIGAAEGDYVEVVDMLSGGAVIRRFYVSVAVAFQEEKL